MILPGKVIAEYVEHGLISIEPHFDEKQLRPFGLRVHLASDVLIAKPGQHVDLTLKKPLTPEFDRYDMRKEALLLRPGSFALCSTIEAFRVSPTLACRLDGRSTLARLGLLVHCTSSVVDGNHREHRTIVLELTNVGPFEVTIPPGIAIGMATFEQIVGEAEVSLEQSQYEGQRTAEPPNLDFRIPRFGEKT